jgi:hypothetical protein
MVSLKKRTPVFIDCPLEQPDTNIMTAEDPVEFQPAGRQPGPDEGADRFELRGCPARLLR